MGSSVAKDSITVELTREDVQLIIDGLNSLPYAKIVKTMPLVQKLGDAIRTQVLGDG